MHKEDLKRVAPLWLKYSKKVRHDPDVRSPFSMVKPLCLTVSYKNISFPFAGIPKGGPKTLNSVHVNPKCQQAFSYWLSMAAGMESDRRRLHTSPG